jgi:MvaI/BcnI restriction endonuclease family
MRQLASFEIENITLLTENAVEFALIEPTATGLNKSILDATSSVRMFLKSNKIHDYSTQKQGPDYKVVVTSTFLEMGQTTNSSASMYRPVTKNGDSRIWFRGLNYYANANDILAIIVFQNNLYVLNVTELKLKALLHSTQSNPIRDLILAIGQDSNFIANELLSSLKNIANRGFIPAMLDADTAVGRTLETLLGIDINSSKEPDYKGIELKSYRAKRENRKNLFAQVPDWKRSKFKSSAEILNNFGYSRGDDFKLYCTVSCLAKNSQGLKLRIDNNVSQLLENSDLNGIGDFAVWDLENLHNRLIEKHNETFWIGAESKIIEGKEFLRYTKVEHTKKPIVSQFDLLLQQGVITLDHLIKSKPSGGVVEKGPIFKIKSNGLNLLFPPSKTYSLI